jgi:hypothetical protein
MNEAGVGLCQCFQAARKAERAREAKMRDKLQTLLALSPRWQTRAQIRITALDSLQHASSALGSEQIAFDL